MFYTGLKKKPKNTKIRILTRSKNRKKQGEGQKSKKIKNLKKNRKFLRPVLKSIYEKKKLQKSNLRPVLKTGYSGKLNEIST